MTRVRPPPNLSLLATVLLLFGLLAGRSEGQANAGGATNPAANAYLDETARRLIQGARAARDARLAGVRAYTALVRERMAIGSPGLTRDRPLANGEHAARVRWSRDEPDVIHVLGSRMRHPGLGPGDPPSFFRGTAARLAADPLRDPFHFTVDYSFFLAGSSVPKRSPLEANAERHYRFRSGDTITVGLPSGHSVQAIQVTAIPRRRDITLLAAMLWIDPESHGVVRVAYRMAKRIDSEARWTLRGPGGWALGLTVDFGDAAAVQESEAGPLSPDRGEDAPSGQPPTESDEGSRGLGLGARLLNSLYSNWLGPLELDLSTVVVDYTLWELGHWLPRQVTRVGYLRAGSEPGAAGDDSVLLPFFHEWSFAIEDVDAGDSGDEPVRDASAADVLAEWRSDSDSIEGDVASGDPGETVTIIPRDRRALADAEWLPPPAWTDNSGNFASPDIAEMGAWLDEIDASGGSDADLDPSPWVFHPPLWTLRLLRTNVVEGFSAGTRLHRYFAWGSAVATLRVGTKRTEPDAELTFERDHPGLRLRASVYHSLRAATFEGLGTVSGGLDGGETSDFHVASGGSLRLLPPRDNREWISARLFAERHTELVSGARTSRWGAALRWRPWWGGDPVRSVNGGGDVWVDGWLGDNESVRAAATGALVVPLPGYWSAALEAGVAHIWGAPAPHDLWSVGGAGAWLRGYPARSLAGSSVRRARAEIQRPVRFVRLALFADWATDGTHDLYSTGAGLIVMDGLMRVDLARGLVSRPDLVDGGDPLAPGWRVHLRGDAFF